MRGNNNQRGGMKTVEKGKMLKKYIILFKKGEKEEEKDRYIKKKEEQTMTYTNSLTDLQTDRQSAVTQKGMKNMENKNDLKRSTILEDLTNLFSQTFFL